MINFDDFDSQTLILVGLLFQQQSCPYNLYSQALNKFAIVRALEPLSQTLPMPKSFKYLQLLLTLSLNLYRLKYADAFWQTLSHLPENQSGIMSSKRKKGPASASSSSASSSSSSSNPALLILHPDNVLSPNPSLYRAPLVKQNLEPYFQVDAYSGTCDPDKVKRCLLSGKYPVTLVCDLSKNFQW